MMKENDGRGARRRKFVRLLLGCSVLLLLLLVVGSLLLLPLSQDNVIPPSNGNSNSERQRDVRGRHRKKKMFPRKKVNRTSNASTSSSYSEKNEATIEAILNGNLSFINLHIPEDAFSPKEDYYYNGGIKGLFCRIDWSLQESDPTMVPMFRDLVESSPDCQKKTHSIDFGSVVRALHAKASEIHVLPPAGFIFSESRCGSTLVANILAAMNPTKHRVYSEALPPLVALRACHNYDEDDDSSNCSKDRGIQLVRDVIGIMGLTNAPSKEENRIFFKLQSLAPISLLRCAFPNVPWIFVYRQPEQVMMSYFNSKSSSSIQQNACLRQQQNDPFLNDKRREESSSKEQQCASTLASFCKAAILEHEKSSGTGRFVNYKNLKEILLGSILPHHFGLKVGELERERIHAVSMLYSKRRKRKQQPQQQIWVEDSTEKETAATEAVRDACREFLWDSYNTMERLSIENEPPAKEGKK